MSLSPSLLVILLVLVLVSLLVECHWTHRSGHYHHSHRVPSRRYHDHSHHHHSHRRLFHSHGGSPRSYQHHHHGGHRYRVRYTRPRYHAVHYVPRSASRRVAVIKVPYPVIHKIPTMKQMSIPLKVPIKVPLKVNVHIQTVGRPRKTTLVKNFGHMLQDDDDGEGDSGKEENTQAGDEGSEEPDNEKNEPSNEGNIEETVINQAVNLQADNPNENYQDLPGPMLDFDEGSVDDPFTVEQFYQQLTKNQYSSSQRQRPWPPRVTVGGSNDNEDSDGEKEMGDAGDDPGPWNPLGGGGGDGGEETDSYQKDIELSEKDLDATPPSDSEETDEVSARKDTPEGVSPSGPASSGTEPVRVSSLDAGAHPWESIRNPRGVTENLGAN